MLLERSSRPVRYGIRIRCPSSYIQCSVELHLVIWNLGLALVKSPATAREEPR